MSSTPLPAISPHTGKRRRAPYSRAARSCQPRSRSLHLLTHTSRSKKCAESVGPQAACKPLDYNATKTTPKTKIRLSAPSPAQSPTPAARNASRQESTTHHSNSARRAYANPSPGESTPHPTTAIASSRASLYYHLTPAVAAGSTSIPLLLSERKKKAERTTSTTTLPSQNAASLLSGSLANGVR